MGLKGKSEREKKRRRRRRRRRRAPLRCGETSKGLCSLVVNTNDAGRCKCELVVIVNAIYL